MVLVEGQKNLPYVFDSKNPSEAKENPEIWSPETNRSIVAVMDDHGELILSSPRPQGKSEIKSIRTKAALNNKRDYITP